MPSITFLNFSGDVTITWDKENEQEVLNLVESKMKEGYSFFISKSSFFGLFPKEVEAKSIKEVKSAGKATLRTNQARHMAEIAKAIDDSEVASLLASKKANLIPAPKRDESEELVRAKSAREVVQAQSSTAVRRVVGG